MSASESWQERKKHSLEPVWAKAREARGTPRPAFTVKVFAKAGTSAFRPYRAGRRREASPMVHQVGKLNNLGAQRIIP